MKQVLINAQVEQITPLTDSILKIIFKPERYIPYQAGQYLNLVCVDHEFSYSIANAPLGARHYEIHMRHSVDNSYNHMILNHIKQYGCMNMKVPYGTCSLDRLDAQRPILFIAGGTGFAPVHAMIEQLLANADPRCFELYWSARTSSDLYFEPKVVHWQTHAAHFNYYSFLSEEQKDTLFPALLAHHAHDLSMWQCVLSGPFDMVYRLRDDLVTQGIKAEHLFSDAFDFE